METSISVRICGDQELDLLFLQVQPKIATRDRDGQNNCSTNHFLYLAPEDSLLTRPQVWTSLYDLQTNL